MLENTKTRFKLRDLSGAVREGATQDDGADDGGHHGHDDDGGARHVTSLVGVAST